MLFLVRGAVPPKCTSISLTVDDPYCIFILYFLSLSGHNENSACAPSFDDGC